MPAWCLAEVLCLIFSIDEAILRECLRSGTNYEAVRIACDYRLQSAQQVTTDGSLSHKEVKHALNGTEEKIGGFMSYLQRL